jgi:hypothetical protein
MRNVGVHEPVAVVRSPAEPSASRAVSEHRVARARLESTALRLRETAEESHEHLVTLAVGVDAAAQLWHPEVGAVVGQLREDEVELSAGERALRLGDDERRPTQMRICDVREETHRLRPARPGTLT